MCDIAIMLGLAFFMACGVCLTMAACLGGESVLPLISIILGFAALITVCAFDLLRFDDWDMPSALADTGQSVAVTRSDMGWWLCGIFITGAWACPLIVARHGFLDMKYSWISSVGTWSLVMTLGLGLVFFSKGQQRDPGGGLY